MCSPVSNRASLRIKIKSGNHGIGSILNARLSSRIGYRTRHRTLFVAANRRLLCISILPIWSAIFPFLPALHSGDIAKYPASLHRWASLDSGNVLLFVLPRQLTKETRNSWRKNVGIELIFRLSKLVEKELSKIRYLRHGAILSLQHLLNVLFVNLLLRRPLLVPRSTRNRHVPITSNLSLSSINRLSRVVKKRRK